MLISENRIRLSWACKEHEAVIATTYERILFYLLDFRFRHFKHFNKHHKVYLLDIIVASVSLNLVNCKQQQTKKIFEYVFAWIRRPKG